MDAERRATPLRRGYWCQNDDGAGEKTLEALSCEDLAFLDIACLSRCGSLDSLPSNLDSISINGAGAVL